MNLLPTPPEPSLAEKHAISIERRRKAGLEALKQTTIALFRSFWYPSDGVHPQQIADQFGVNTATAFAQHAATVSFLESQGVTFTSAEKTPPSDKYTYVINANGTVTITDVVDEEENP